MTHIRTARRVRQYLRRPEFRKKLKLFAEVLAFASLILCVIVVTFLVAPWLTIDDALLRLIVSSTSIVVALIVGFLFNSYFHIKQVRLERLSRFVKLQDRLRLYQEAFWALVQQLLDRYRSKVDFQLNKTLRELQRDENFVRTDHSLAVLWIHAIWDAATLPFDTPDFEVTSSILSEERLQKIYEGVQEACGLLSRQKYYKHILKTLGYEVTSDFDKVMIADNQYGLQHSASKLLKRGDEQDFRTLEFWETRFEECLDLLERMKSHGRFIYSFVPSEIRKLSAYLLFVSVFGIIVPLLTLSLSSLLGTWKITLSVLSFVGFLVFFSASLLDLYRRLTERKLSL